jgi:hypothetical protein
MSAAIKSDTSINGMKINNSEYLLSQYADDSSFILDKGDDSLRKSLYIFNNVLFFSTFFLQFIAVLSSVERS